MMGGMNPAMMKQAMKRMGIKPKDIDATEVIIRCADRDIVIQNPSVTEINMGGQKTWQLMGQDIERARVLEDAVPEITDEDIKTVVDQTGISEEKARKALEETEGDIAEAIMKLSGAEEE